MLRISPLWSSFGPKTLKYFSPQTRLSRPRSLCVEIEEVLRVGVPVERPQRVQVGFVGEVRFKPAVGRGRRRIDRTVPPVRWPTARGAWCTRSCCAAGSRYRSPSSTSRRRGERRCERRRRAGAAIVALLELVGVDVVREAQRHQMLPLLRAVQAVDYQDVFETPPVERPNNGAAYQASAPGNDDSSTAKIVHKAPEISNPPGQRPSPLAGKMQAIRK